MNCHIRKYNFTFILPFILRKCCYLQATYKPIYAVLQIHCLTSHKYDRTSGEKQVSLVIPLLQLEINPFMHDVKKWSNILLKSCSVNQA